MFGFLVGTSAIRAVLAGGFPVTGPTAAAGGFGSKVSGGLNCLLSYKLPMRIRRWMERSPDCVVCQSGALRMILSFITDETESHYAKDQPKRT